MNLGLLTKGFIKCQAEIFFKDIATSPYPIYTMVKFLNSNGKAELYRLPGKTRLKTKERKSDLTSDTSFESLKFQKTKYPEFKRWYYNPRLSFSNYISRKAQDWEEGFRKSHKVYNIYVLHVFFKITKGSSLTSEKN